MATVSSLCAVFPILTPTLSKPRLAPLSCRIPKRRRISIITSVAEDREIVPVSEGRGTRLNEVEGFQPSEPHTESEVVVSSLTSSSSVNAIIVLGFGTFAVTKLLTIDHDYWHGWTLYEIVRYIPEHNWIAYEQALKANPVLAKMAISGIVYSIGDWIAQCYEGKPLFEFDRTRVLRSGLVGFTLHGSLSHYYYQLCEALFPFQEWWVVPAKVAFDQTVWSAIWNSIYFVVLGLLRFESLTNIYGELKSTFLPLLTQSEQIESTQSREGGVPVNVHCGNGLVADCPFGVIETKKGKGWKLWPFAHLITYGVIPVEQRLLWVDCVELIWVTILSTYSNEKSEARISEAASETGSSTSSENSKEYIHYTVTVAGGTSFWLRSTIQVAVMRYIGVAFGLFSNSRGEVKIGTLRSLLCNGQDRRTERLGCQI
ncbi:hypothetical protein JHK82_034476 [Glycine max]|nr:hypothetical protein JHK85_035186 [Glycine max]KAG4986855.1 hypothetical protein JHK86_034546 [Glycine max]KAG5120056.1 hypothetical protein JHK82_034476 [Glycine max]KAG5141042.1 hypothetical protein JHK84_034810 [Glycine max]